MAPSGTTVCQLLASSVARCPTFRYSQSITTGVWPDAIVAGVGSTGRKFPGLLQLTEELDAGRDVGRAAVRQRRHHHPVEPGRRLGGIAVQRDLAAELRLEQVVDAGHGRHAAGVVPGSTCSRRDQADPEAVRVLQLVRDVVPGCHLVRGEQIGVQERHAAAEIEDVGGAPWPRSWFAALISSWLLASGWALLTSMPYFSAKVSIIAP